MTGAYLLSLLLFAVLHGFALIKVVNTYGRNFWIGLTFAVIGICFVSGITYVFGSTYGVDPFPIGLLGFVAIAVGILVSFGGET